MISHESKESCVYPTCSDPHDRVNYRGECEPCDDYSVRSVNDPKACEAKVCDSSEKVKKDGTCKKCELNWLQDDNEPWKCTINRCQKHQFI